MIKECRGEEGADANIRCGEVDDEEDAKQNKYGLRPIIHVDSARLTVCCFTSQFHSFISLTPTEP